jgi:hypothetical protein
MTIPTSIGMREDPHRDGGRKDQDDEELAEAELVQALVPLQVMLPTFWVASTKPEVGLRRAKVRRPWRGGG